MAKRGAKAKPDTPPGQGNKPPKPEQPPPQPIISDVAVDERFFAADSMIVAVIGEPIRPPIEPPIVIEPPPDTGEEDQSRRR